MEGEDTNERKSGRGLRGKTGNIYFWQRVGDLPAAEKAFLRGQNWDHASCN